MLSSGVTPPNPEEFPPPTRKTLTDFKMRINVYFRIKDRFHKCNLDSWRNLIVQTNKQNPQSHKDLCLGEPRTGSRRIHSSQALLLGTTDSSAPPGRMLLFISQVAAWRLVAGLEGRVHRKRDTGDAAPYHMMEISTLRRKEKEEGSLNPPFSDTSPGSQSGEGRKKGRWVKVFIFSVRDLSICKLVARS